MAENKSVIAGGWEWTKELAIEEYKGTFQGARNVLRLDCGGGYTTVCV